MLANFITGFFWISLRYYFPAAACGFRRRRMGFLTGPSAYTIYRLVGRADGGAIAAQAFAISHFIAADRHFTTRLKSLS